MLYSNSALSISTLVYNSRQQILHSRAYNLMLEHLATCKIASNCNG